MPKAKSLADLLRIRDKNAATIDRINGNLGSALGFKVKNNTMTKEPAVIIFVPNKVSDELLPPDQQVPKTLDGPDGLTCVTDVIVGKKAAQEPPSLPLSTQNQQIVAELHAGNVGIIGGIQLGFFESDGRGYVGTAACLVQRKVDGRQIGRASCRERV